MWVAHDAPMTYRLTAQLTAGGFTVRGPLGTVAWDRDLERAAKTVAALVDAHPLRTYFTKAAK